VARPGTVGARLEACGGFGPGFDFVRIALAFGVLVWHTVAVVEGSAENAKQAFIWPFVYAILPMFFALSGFLVTASALRLPLREYVLNRSFRIVPALAVDIFFCALVLGPIITTFALGAYFTDPQFRAYFLNIIGWIHYLLPGVFLDNPNRGIVNGALWTVPYEIGCYVVMSLMIWVGIIRRWTLVLGSVLLITGTAALLHLAGFSTGLPLADRFVDFAFFSKGASLIPCFLAGSAIYLMRHFLPWDWKWAAAVVAALVATGLFAPPSWFANPLFIAGSVLPLSYLVVWLGLADLPKLPVFDRGDYSYGVYLYHYPILQLLQMLFGFSQWWVLALAALVPVTLFAMFSWHSIEKPVLKQRKRFSLVGARLAAEDQAKASGGVAAPAGSRVAPPAE
jgi:peptidoglycan/LPS O-acetylase OafA/YrhL